MNGLLSSFAKPSTYVGVPGHENMTASAVNAEAEQSLPPIARGVARTEQAFQHLSDRLNILRDRLSVVLRQTPTVPAACSNSAQPQAVQSQFADFLDAHAGRIHALAAEVQDILDRLEV